eukprot:gb/GEZN01005887.1/.p2 GENE.gb/GEZN01005887.1/~~gb/GEZN01005887.1/.p2  ORF type:complete len:158 (-),score=16.02 gb/GEZN01005887.1/:198-671(-)
MSFFKKLTSVAPSGRLNAVVMGRKTWESLPTTFRPLPNRLNVIVTSQETLRDGMNVQSKDDPMVQACGSFSEALALTRSDHRVASVFVIGGGDIYRQAFESPLCQTIYLTQILKHYECDTFLPELKKVMEKFYVKKLGEVIMEGCVPYRFLTLELVA